MKKLRFILPLAAVFTMTGCNNDAKKSEIADDKSDSVITATDTASSENAATAAAAPDSAAMVKAWMDFKTPGEMHKWLASGNGKYTGEYIGYHEGKAMPPEKVTQECRMILNGLYQETIFKGTMMGEQFEGRSVTGYDNIKKKFFSTWVDNMGSGIMLMEGNLDQSGKKLEMKGKMTDAMTGGDCEIRQVLTFSDEKTQLMEMFSTVNGKEEKMMETRLSRK